MAIERSVRINVETGNAKSQLKSLSTSLRESDKAAGLLKTSLAGLAAGFSLRQAIDQIVRFEDEMAGVRAVSGATAKQFAELSKQARLLGATTSFGAEQAAGAQRFLAQAGFEVNEILSATPGILNLAKAGQLGLADAADIASNVLSGLRLEVDQLNRVNDVLVKAANSSNTNVRQLGESFAYAAPFAAAAGISLEETAAFIGAVGDAGIQAGRAGTDFAGFIRQLSLITPNAAEALNKYGISVKDVDISTRGLIPVIKTLSAAGISVTDAFKIFGTEAGDSAQIILSSVDKVEKLTSSFKNAEGAASSAAAIMGDTLGASIKGLTSAIAEATLQAGDSGLTGALRDVIVVTTGVIQSYNGLSDEFREANNLTDGQVSAIEALTTVTQLLAVAYGSRLAGGLATATKATIASSIAQLTATKRATGLSAALGVQAQRLTAATVAANAYTLAARGANTVLAALGGPAGIAITAGAALLYYVSALESADEKQRKARQSAQDYVDTLQGAAVIQFTTALFNAEEAADSAQNKFDETKNRIAQLEAQNTDASRAIAQGLRKQLPQLEADVVNANNKVAEISNTFKEAAKSAQLFAGSVNTGESGNTVDLQAAAYAKLKGELDEATRIQNDFNDAVRSIKTEIKDDVKQKELIALAEAKRDKALQSLAARTQKLTDQNNKLHRSFSDLLGDFNPAVKVANDYAEAYKEIEKSTATDAEKKILIAKAQQRLNEELDKAVTTTKEYSASYNPLIAAEIQRDNALKELEKTQGTLTEKQSVALEIQRQYNQAVQEATPNFTRLNAQFSAVDAATVAYVDTLKQLDEAERKGLNVTQLRTNALMAYQKAAKEARAQDQLNKTTAESYFGAFQQGLTDSLLTAESSYDQIREAGRSAISDLSSSIADFISTGEGDFRSFASNVINELLRIQTQILLTEGLKESGGLGGIASSIGGALGFGGSTETAEPSVDTGSALEGISFGDSASSFSESWLSSLDGVNSAVNDTFGNAIAQSNAFNESSNSAAESIGSSLVGSLVKMATQLVTNAVVGETVQTGATAAGVAAAQAMASAWAPAAAAVSLASFGANSPPAIAGMTAAYTSAQTLSSVGATFARGGVIGVSDMSNSVVSTPTKFAMGGTTGQLGEAGAEAILPLQRTAGGELGVKGTTGQAQTVNVSPPEVNVRVVNVTENPQEWATSPQGEKTIMNVISRNRSALGL